MTIYLEWIAERGYHRECHENALKAREMQKQSAEKSVTEHEKRRERKRLKRIAEKAERRTK